MSRNRVFLCLLLLPLGVALSAATFSNARADECRPYELRVWPYRIVLDAPPTAKPGERVTYRIDYERVNRTSSEPFGFVFQWSKGVTFQSARFLEGPEGVAVNWDTEMVLWEFPGRPKAGAMEVVLKIDSAFSGDIGVSAKFHRPGMPANGSAEFQRMEVSENPPERSREFAWMQHMVILSGPQMAYSGDVVEYRIDYERTRSTGVPLGGLVLAWPEEAASLISTEPKTTLTPMGPGYMDLGIGNAESGSIAVRLQIRPDFTGCLGVGWYLRGTGIMHQIGSVTHVETDVVARTEALPGAGDSSASCTTP